jgi:GNAT superfamily N-acetyltransferase
VQGRRRRPATLLLFSMWVDPDARRDGVGRELIARLEEWARGWDALETVLWVFAANSSALDFYRDLGFEPVREGQDAESGARFAAVAMRREIHSPTP